MLPPKPAAALQEQEGVALGLHAVNALRSNLVVTVKTETLIYPMYHYSIPYLHHVLSRGMPKTYCMSPSRANLSVHVFD